MDLNNYKSKLIHMNSTDRVNKPSKTTDCRFNLGSDIELSNVQAIVVKELSCVHGMYNVNEYNNTFVYKDGTGNQTATIVEGQYTLDQFRSALSLAIFISGTSVNITQDSITKKLTITAFSLANFFDVASDGTVNPMAQLFGLSNQESGLTTDPVIANALPDLSGPKNLYLRSPELGSSNSIESRTDGSGLKYGVNSEVVDVIPVLVPFGSTIHHQPADHALDQVIYSDNGNTLENISFQITDDRGRVLNNNGLEVSLTLIMYHA